MSNGRHFSGRLPGRRSLRRKLSRPRQFLPQEFVDQIRDSSPLLERQLIQNLADIKLQPHELNIHASPPKPSFRLELALAPVASFDYATPRRSATAESQAPAASTRATASLWVGSQGSPGYRFTLAYGDKSTHAIMSPSKVPSI